MSRSSRIPPRSANGNDRVLTERAPLAICQGRFAWWTKGFGERKARWMPDHRAPPDLAEAGRRRPYAPWWRDPRRAVRTLYAAREGMSMDEADRIRTKECPARPRE